MRIPMNQRVILIGEPNAPKLLYAGDDWLGESQPQVLVQEDSIRLVAGLDKGVTIDDQFGTMIQGPCSLADMPEHIRMASYWCFNPMLLTCIGSSAAMNIPVLIPTVPPVIEAKKGFSKIVSGL